MIKIGVLLGLLSASLPASARADGAAAPACPIAAQLEGEAALTTAVAQALRSHGIATQPPAGCPQTFIRVARTPRGLVVSIHQELAETERVVGDPAVAAALIESWMRSDLTDPLLVAPELLEPPASLVPPPPVPPPPVPPPRPGTRFTVSLLFEAGIDKDAASWLGGSLSGCAPVGPICLGAIVRGAANFPATGVGTYLDERLAVDVLASVSWPLRRGRWVVAPGLGLGAGWLRHRASPVATSESELEDTGDSAVVGSEGGMRAELRLLAMLRLRAGWMLTGSVALDSAFLDETTTQLPAGTGLPVAPWLMLRGGLGLSWSSP